MFEQKFNFCSKPVKIKQPNAHSSNNNIDLSPLTDTEQIDLCKKFECKVDLTLSNICYDAKHLLNNMVLKIAPNIRGDITDEDREYYEDLLVKQAVFEYDPIIEMEKLKSCIDRHNKAAFATYQRHRFGRTNVEAKNAEMVCPLVSPNIENSISRKRKRNEISTMKVKVIYKPVSYGFNEHRQRTHSVDSNKTELSNCDSLNPFDISKIAQQTKFNPQPFIDQTDNHVSLLDTEEIEIKIIETPEMKPQTMYKKETEVSIVNFNLKESSSQNPSKTPLKNPLKNLSKHLSRKRLNPFQFPKSIAKKKAKRSPLANLSEKHVSSSIARKYKIKAVPQMKPQSHALDYEAIEHAVLHFDSIYDPDSLDFDCKINCVTSTQI